MSIEINSVDLTFPVEAQKIFIPVVFGLISFVIYWFTYQNKKLEQTYYKKYDSDLAAEKFIFFVKILGGLTMGLLPLILCLIFFSDTGLADYGLVPDSDYMVISLIWLFGLGAILFGLSNYGGRRPKHWKTYPQMKIKKWTKRAKLKNGIAWGVYLIGYEILFRGVLLFGLIDVIGFWPTVAINIALYSGTHIPKGIEETVGAIPLSFIFCLITLQCGNVWPVAIAHVVMACTSYLTVIKHNPELESVN